MYNCVSQSLAAITGIRSITVKEIIVVSSHAWSSAPTCQRSDTQSRAVVSQAPLSTSPASFVHDSLVFPSPGQLLYKAFHFIIANYF